jgi:sulfoxide reductase heme-binding subunit YedZ
MFSSIANITAFIALILYVLTLVPTGVRAIFKPLVKTKWYKFLLRNRREVGVAAWIFGMIHGTYILFERNLNLLDPEILKEYFQGLTLITIFTLLAVTSNDLSVKKLKKNWKRLHRLTYLVFIFLPWHIIDKMYFKSSPSIWTIPGLILMGLIIILTGARVFKGYQKKRSKG